MKGGRGRKSDFHYEKVSGGANAAGGGFELLKVSHFMNWI
jgi:hypothetical protein